MKDLFVELDKKVLRFILTVLIILAVLVPLGLGAYWARDYFTTVYSISSGNFTITGNVSASAYHGDGSQLTGVSGVDNVDCVVTANGSSWTGTLSCDGVDDEVQFEAAKAYGDKILLSPGTFNLSPDGEFFTDNVTWVGSGCDSNETTGTILHLASSADTIRVVDRGKLWNMTVTTPDNYTGVAVHVLPYQDADHGVDRQTDVIKNVAIIGDETNATGIGMLVSANSTSHENRIQLSTFHDFVISGYEYGLYLFSTESGNDGYLNGNSFINFIVDYCQYSIKGSVTGASNPEINQNYFTNFQIQARSGISVDAINLNAAVQDLSYNHFYGSLWDNSHLGGSTINITDYCYYNEFRGNLGQVDGYFPSLSGCYYNTFYDTGVPTFDINPRTPNGVGNGIRIKGTLGETLTTGKLAFLNTDNKWYSTLAATSANATKMVGLVSLGGNANENTYIILHGVMKLTGWSFTVGAPVYISESVSGNFTGTAPSGSSEIVRIVGYCVGYLDTIYFDPDKSWIELE